MSGNSIEAERILSTLNSTVTPEVKRNAEFVDEFVVEFRSALKRLSPPKGQYTVSVIHAGSAYEGLAVSRKSDFDITICLWDDLVSDNFDITRDRSGYFVLEKREGQPHHTHFDCNGIVDAGKLQRSLFNAFGVVIQNMREHMPHAEITSLTPIQFHKHRHAALQVELHKKGNPGRKVSIDLVPQIPFCTWGQCPDLIPLEHLPKSLRVYIDTLNRNKSPIMFFNMGILNLQSFSNADQLFNISFSLLEKKFINTHTDIRDMVRMVKYIAERRNWKRKYAFKSFYAKRVAVKYCDQLKGKDLWEGCKILLHWLGQEVGAKIIDGYFVKNQVMSKWTAEEARDFQSDIDLVRSMNVRDL